METKHLIWIGAGGAILPFFDFDDFNLVTLVEARSSAAECLRERFKNNVRVNLEEVVISDVSEENIFFNLKPEGFSQVGDISSVRELFPNVAIKDRSEITTTSLMSFLEGVCSDSDRLTIVFDLPNANEKLVERAIAQRANYYIESFYVLNASEGLIGSIDDGFKLIGRLEGDICGNYVHFYRDPEILSLRKQLIELRNSSAEKVKNLECEIEKYRNDIHASLAINTSLQQKEFSVLGQMLSDMLDALKSAYIQQGKASVDALKSEFEKISASISSNKSQTAEIVELFPAIREQLKSDFVSELDKANKALNSVSDNVSFGEKLEQLNCKIEELAVNQSLFMDKQNSEDVARVIRNIPFLLQKNSYNTSKQIESFISLNKYINHHEIPLSFHGWPISPDIGLTLIDYIENKNVDIVLEFGSGTSSVLFAKAFKLANSDTHNWCLKRPIISFEHNEEYLEKTSELLSSHNCRDMVNLTHAPLIDFEYNEQEKFLYYDCEEVIKELSESLGDKKKTALILIDGPPGVTNKNARFPALPILLNHMSKHRLIVVMDDYSRDDEKQTFELWQALTDKRYLSHSIKIIETEKGLAILTIN